MRKPVLSVLGAGLAAAPVTVALAAEPHTDTTKARETAQVNAVDKRVSIDLRREARDKQWLAHRRAAHKLRRARAKRTAAAAPAAPPALEAIAACESGGNPAAVGGGGKFRGKYQFDYGTWASVGGSGDPAAAPEAEQDKRAAILYSRAGSSPWPVCG
ncbi:MAG: transglycosylase family protein [Thermoleophilaceae bacterium]